MLLNAADIGLTRLRDAVTLASCRLLLLLLLHLCLALALSQADSCGLLLVARLLGRAHRLGEYLAAGRRLPRIFLHL